MAQTGITGKPRQKTPIVRGLACLAGGGHVPVAHGGDDPYHRLPKQSIFCRHLLFRAYMKIVGSLQKRWVW